MKMMVEGKEVLFNDEDMPIIEGKKLYLYTRKSKSYVIYKNQRIHRIILGLTDNRLVVDHKNGNPLDNRRENLRVCLQSQNAKNRGKSEGVYTSKFKGVFFKKDKWMAKISTNYKAIHIGSFETEEDAAKAYNNAAEKLHGEFAYLNKIN